MDETPSRRHRRPSRDQFTGPDGIATMLVIQRMGYRVVIEPEQGGQVTAILSKLERGKSEVKATARTAAAALSRAAELAGIKS